MDTMIYVPAWLARYDLTVDAMCVYGSLLYAQEHTGTMDVTTVADVMGTSNRKVEKGIRELMDAGLLLGEAGTGRYAFCRPPNL